jgi:purine-binding chemotaxis protein CheW
MQNKAVINQALPIQGDLQIVSFNLGKEEFGIYIEKVQEIIKIIPVTPVPLTKPYVEGLINIRGNIIPLVNLRLKMNFNPAKFSRQTRIIVVNHENRRVGLIVDRMNEVIRVPNDKINPPPYKGVEENGEQNLEAICVLENRIISILDIQKILEIS